MLCSQHHRQSLLIVLRLSLDTARGNRTRVGRMMRRAGKCADWHCGVVAVTCEPLTDSNHIGTFTIEIWKNRSFMRHSASSPQSPIVDYRGELRIHGVGLRPLHQPAPTDRTGRPTNSQVPAPTAVAQSQCQLWLPRSGRLRNGIICYRRHRGRSVLKPGTT